MIRVALHHESPDRRGRGSLAARRAVGALRERRGFPALRGDDLLERSALGQPLLVTPPGAPGYLVSLTHVEGVSFAYVRPRTSGLLGIGFDAERRDRDHQGLVEGGFTPSERRVLETGCGVDGLEIRALKAWCAKEAVVKALGTGFNGDPAATVCREAGASGFWFLTVGGFLVRAVAHVRGPWVFACSHYVQEASDADRISA